MPVKGRLRRPFGTQDFFIGVATQHWRAGLKSPPTFQAFTLALTQALMLIMFEDVPSL